MVRRFRIKKEIPAILADGGISLRRVWAKSFCVKLNAKENADLLA